MILRAKQAYVGLLCEKQTLEFGISYYSPAFAALPEANQYREVIAATSEQAKASIDEAKSCFHQLELTCYIIAPAEGNASTDLHSALEKQNFVRHEIAAMLLTQWASPFKPEKMRVLPARAVRQAYRSVLMDSISHSDNQYREQAIAAAIERLDSPQLDVFVAMEAGKPIGYGGLFLVGDIALITEMGVVSDVDPLGVWHALLDHILTLAKRLEMRNICYELIDSASDELKTTLESWGFVSDGIMEEYRLSVS